ncbi:MAG: NAD(P)/FAD-dependent oxidoreductase [Eubacterium sp.]|nr:NAD(P)/FAD-dependent oxidoreductase [Eubacterium sp.]
MSKKIIVAGGGHGGIATAAFLAEKGFDVTVYERHSRKNMGYDWTDIFDPGALFAAGLDMPPEDKFEYKVNMTFYGPNEKTPIRQRVPENELEIKMERRDIYDMLITRAENAGVKFEFEHAITAPIMCGDRVVGIKTDKGEHYADMVIDACGVESPVRANLPDCCNVQKHPVDFEKFYVYRAFCNKASDEKVEDKYKVYLLPEGKLGIGWVAAEENYTDLLIGRFEPFDMAEAERTAEYFRSKNPILGTEVLRGGQFTEISVRQPLSVLVADGYAAIGDSAFMTVPIIGSGIANALKMSRVLADVIIADSTETYSAETLWKYQLDFYKMMGSGLAPLAAVKLLLTRITPDQLDYILDNGILTWKELTITANSTNLSSMLSFSSDMPQRALMIVKNKELLKQLLRVAGDIAKVVAVTAVIPKHYARHSVKKWAKKYDGIFK